MKFRDNFAPTLEKINNNKIMESNSKAKKQIEEKELLRDFREKAEACKLFINDPRYSEFTNIIRYRLGQLTELRKRLTVTCKSQEEYVMKGVEYDTRINTIEWFLDLPSQIQETYERLKGEGKGNE